ncbi:ethylene-responsive transcription factor ERF020-like [Elaeis guineensis]|uniref:Ethylene-responsive transcription factor ERF020 n=1 Tax=Elaeis guineensis var. tenera TaxID=51953 RepID=A0A6I9RPY2_ELAGV|nr:ethylene-responsive transcription factor ERF020 [Elaeis guineensis]
MRRSEEQASRGSTGRTAGKEIRYRGVRRRRWGKWVSEIRIPGSRKRLWLGSYSAPQAAAVAHDTAMFLLRGPSSSSGLNFPDHVTLSDCVGMSPKSIQRAASDAGMAIDAELIAAGPFMEATWERGGLSCGN